MALRRTIDATSEPLTTAEAKAHLRVTGSTDDTLIDALVKAARQMAENELPRSLITQTWEKTLDEFPDAIELPYPPIIVVTSVKYYDGAGTQQTLPSVAYALDAKSEPGWIVPAYGYDWPETREMANAVEVTYQAGYGANGGYVPPPIKQWILLMVGHLYENREASIPGVSITALPFIGGLLDPFRVLRV
jgi:uncharacterized phiE125 gp8 family phage protein